jgi:hypothetical protein
VGDVSTAHAGFDLGSEYLVLFTFQYNGKRHRGQIPISGGEMYAGLVEQCLNLVPEALATLQPEAG